MIPANQPNTETPLPVPHRPGWQTTEFWMTALSNAGLLLGAASGALPPKYAVVAVAASQVAYNVSRGLAKQGSFMPTLLPSPVDPQP
jgi:hypothetical protein